VPGRKNITFLKKLSINLSLLVTQILAGWILLSDMIRLKNIPEEARDRLHVYLKTQLQHLNHTMNETLNLEMELEAEKPGMATVSDMCNLINSPGVVSRMSIGGVEKGEIFLVADMTAVHVMNGIMILTPAEVIKSTIESGELTESDSQTFEDIANNLMESLSQTFETIVSTEISIESKGVANVLFNPGCDNLPVLPKGQYLAMGYTFRESEYPHVTFYVLLPRAIGERLFNSSLEPVIDWSDRTIVVIFDTNDKDRAKIRKLLEAQNIGVADFSNHRDVLRSLWREDVNLVIMEITPNNWDSLMISKQLRKSTQTMNIPIIFTLTDPTDQILYLAFKQGVRNFIVKPIRKNELLKKVNQLLEDAA
jgi:twitching motility two-component system response regulator PilH